MNYPTHPSYDQLHEGCMTFAQTYNRAPDVVIGLSRGGLVNAVILSHIFGDVPLGVADYSSRKGQGDQAKEHAQIIPSLHLPNQRILIVDDICDSGHTLAELVKAYESQGHEVVDCYVSYLKESAVFQRTDRTWDIPEDSAWIVFPWEID